MWKNSDLGFMELNMEQFSWILILIGASNSHKSVIINTAKWQQFLGKVLEKRWLKILVFSIVGSWKPNLFHDFFFVFLHHFQKKILNHVNILTAKSLIVNFINLIIFEIFPHCKISHRLTRSHNIWILCGWVQICLICCRVKMSETY